MGDDSCGLREGGAGGLLDVVLFHSVRIFRCPLMIDE